MRSRIAVLTIAAALGLGYLNAGERQAFSGNFRVQLIDDSIWEHCEVEISRWDNSRVEQVSECRWEDGKPQRVTRELRRDEVEVLMALLRNSALFEGKYWGQDRRGLDFSLRTITVDDGARVAALIASFNPSFDDALRANMRETVYPPGN